MKKRFKNLYYQASFDRLIILLASVSLVIALVSAGQIRIVSIGIVSILVIILFIRLIIYWSGSSRKSNPECHRGHEAMNIMSELASQNEMNVKLHPTKSLKIVPELKGAKSALTPFFSGCKVHFGGTVRIGCTTLCGLDNRALKGILAHELAHLRKRHYAKGFLSFLVAIPVIVYVFVSRSVPIIPVLLTITIGILVFSLIYWHHEYEADAVAADFIGKKDMAYAHEKIAGLIHRPGDTLAHPSFKKRISRLLSDKE